MTLAAVWLDGDRLCAIADTRIVRSPGNVLTEHGPKLLPINISCKKPGPSGFFDLEAYRASVGFAYAGGTLPALCTHALANTLFQNLAGPSDAPPPSMQEIARVIGETAERYMREVSQLSGTGGLFDAIVFGFCLATSRLRAFAIRPRISERSLQVDVTECNLAEEDMLLAIGTRPERLVARVAEMRTNVHPAVVGDLPRRALRSLINEGHDETVGGAVQYGWATRRGFEPIADGVPINPPLASGRNIASLVLGFDVLALDAVGPYCFSMAGRV